MRSWKAGFASAIALIAGCGGHSAERVATGTSALSVGDVMGFEVAGDWSTTTPGAVLGLSPIHTEGASSLAVTPSSSNGWTPLTSVALSTLPTLSPTLAVDVMLPTQQANPYWLGAVQMYLTCPSHNIYNAYLSQVELTGEPLATWNTLTFPVTSSEVANLLSSGYSDLTFTVVLNVAVPAGTYLFDNLRFLPLAATACIGQPDGALCDDGSACTQFDTCQAGACTGGTATNCAAADPCHAAGVCDPGTGACLAGPAVADWTPCNDGDLCNRAKACLGGVCSGGQTTCDDGDPCTLDTCSPSTGACGHSVLGAGACTAALEAAPPLQGRVAFSTEKDNNRCVPDAHHVLNRLNAQGELMGWQYDHAGYAGLDSDHFHTETMFRMPYMAGTPLDGSVFVSAWSHPPNTVGSIMGVADLQFKGGRQGELLGTNRAFNANFTGPTADWNVTPNASDTFMRLGPQMTPGQLLDPVQNHPGGGAALGTHVVMALQGFADECSCSLEGVTLDFLPFCGCTPDDSLPIVQTWNLSNPLTPVLDSAFVTHINNTPESDFAASLTGHMDGTSAVAAAITKLEDGRFLLAVNKDSPVSQIEFYVSVGTDLDDPNLFGNPGRAADAIVSVGSPSSLSDLSAQPPDWQSFSFITDCDGSLWILGMRGDNSGYPNADAVDNYLVSIRPAGSADNPSTCTTAYCVNMENAADVPTFVETDFAVLDAEGVKHMQCDDNSGTDQCDMASGAGAYVDPNGQVIIYATDYDDDGGGTAFVYGNGSGDPATSFFGQSCPATANVCPAFGGYIRGKEFHERHGNASVASACPTLADAWVEFYANPNYNSFGDDSGQLYRIDFFSRDERNNKDFGTNDFNKKASSVRWCIPTGSSFALFDGNWTGSSAVLNGTGSVAEIADFSQGLTYPHGGGNVNDNVTSGEFQPNVTDPTMGWKGVPDILR